MKNKTIKRMFIAVITVVLAMSLFSMSAGATESSMGVDTDTMEEESVESIFEGSEAVPENTEMGPNEVEVEESDTYIDAEALDELIWGAESKTQAVIKLAEAMGITVEDAEALIDKFITFGDEHFEDSDLWVSLKQDVSEHPDKWVIIAIVALAFVALIVFLIRSVIKNTLTQTNTKLRMLSIEEHAAGVKKQVEAYKVELDEIKLEADEMRETLDTILEILIAESEAVGSLKSNSDTSLRLTEESAFQILQLLNIAMDRKVPVVTGETRKIWYENAVNKLREKTGQNVTAGGEADE